MGAGTYWDLVEEAVRQRPDETILADDHGRTLTATAFRDAALQAAAGLHARGVGAGDVVSWQLPTTLEAAVLMAACARLGAVQNPIIPVFREREVAFIVRQVQARLVVVPDVWRGFGHGDMARALGPDVLELALDGLPAAAMRLPAGDPATLPPPPAASRGCRWIYYSSGTTSDPKGVRHTDASVIASSHGVVDGLGMATGEIYPIAWPLAHIGGVSMLSSVLRAGGRLVLFDVFDPVTTADRMAAHRPTMLGSATPFFLSYVAAQRRHGDRPLYPRLRVCVGGGAPTPETVNREVSDVLGVPGVVGAWGLTEFPVAANETPDDPLIGTSVGRATLDVRVRVVDGELRLKGPQCFLGYVDPSLDSEAFDDEGWCRSGDVGTIDDEGRVRIEGRIKDIIIRNAENISASEVEDVLLRHPDVRDAAVIGVPDPRTGERVCAVVVVEPGREITLDDLVEHCRAHGLARHKCPDLLEIVEELPRNPMGKVLKRALLTGGPRRVG